MQNEKRQLLAVFFVSWAENETRTRDPNLGKVVLYQLSYFRKYVLELQAFLSDCECKDRAKILISKTFWEKN